MMSWLWILVFGSLIALQGGNVEASEDDGADAEDPPPVEEGDPLPAEDAAPPEDASPPEEGDAAPPEEGDAAPPEEGDAAPPEEGDAAPPEEGDAAPPEEGDASPPEEGDASPPEEGDASPPEEGDAAPPEGEDTATAEEEVSTEAPALVEEVQDPVTELPDDEPEPTDAESDSVPDPTVPVVPEEALAGTEKEPSEPDNQYLEPEIVQEAAPAVNAAEPAEDVLHLEEAYYDSEIQAKQDQEDNPVNTGIEEPLEGVGKARSAGAKAGPSGSEEPQGSGSGTVAGVVGAIGVAIVGAVSGFFAHQKKKLCFKAQERDPERAKEEEGTQNDPQVLSNLLNSS